MTGIDFDDVPNWRGRDVIDENRYAVGVITDLYFDDVTGRPEWAAVKSGLFSHRVTFVPLSQAVLHGMNVQVPYAKAHIHEAPNIEPDGQLSAEEEARLYQHYGLDYGAGGSSGSDSEFLADTRLRRHEAAE